MIDRLHYISQAPEGSSHIAAIENVLVAGGKWIQLRVKNLTEEEVLPLAIEAVALCKQYGAKLIVNDFPLVALNSGAHGLHLGLDDMPIAEARALVGTEMIIGGTANTLAHIELRVKEGADYIGLGPFRFTNTKLDLSPVIGLHGYIDLMEQSKQLGISLPIIAIGGIQSADISLLRKTGIHGVAVSGALTSKSNMANAIQELQQQLNATVH